MCGDTDCPSCGTAQGTYGDPQDYANLDLVRVADGRWGYRLALHEDPKGSYPTREDAMQAALLEPSLRRYSLDQVRVRCLPNGKN